MTLPLTRETLAAAYDYLCTTPPFNKWNLPDSDDVDLKSCRDLNRIAYHQWDGVKHYIRVSTKFIGRTKTLLQVMAHEMIHVHEYHARGAKGSGEHSAAFHKWSTQVCRWHGFDPKEF